MFRLTSREIASMAAFTALVAGTTMAFVVSIPETRGFFNLGEIMVYTTALLMGPIVGAFAGGVGSMIADITLGFGYFAPGTLLIKGAEGFIVGYLTHRRHLNLSRSSWRLISTAVGLGAGTLLYLIGTTLYVGEAELTMPLLGLTVRFSIPNLFWLSLAVVVLLAVAIGGWITEPGLGWTLLAIILGGLAMVTGYFLYEFSLFGLLGLTSRWAALAEIPPNVGQMTIGLLASIPLAKRTASILRGRGLLTVALPVEKDAVAKT